MVLKRNLIFRNVFRVPYPYRTLTTVYKVIFQMDRWLKNRTQHSEQQFKFLVPLQNLDHCIQGYLPNGSMASERNPTFRTVFSVLQHCKTFINEKRFSLWINCFKEAPYLQKCILSFTPLQNQDQRIKV